MKAAIILAAGQGRRFGANKMLSLYKDRPLVTHALDAACAAADYIIAVTGHEAEAVAAVIRRHAKRSVTIVVANDFAEGMAASLRSGIQALPQDTDAVAVFLGDMPEVPHDLAGGLFAALRELQAAAPVHKGRRGHPAVFARSLFPRLLALQGDQGARELFTELAGGWARVPCDDAGIFVDIDRPDAG